MEGACWHCCSPAGTHRASSPPPCQWASVCTFRPVTASYTTPIVTIPQFRKQPEVASLPPSLTPSFPHSLSVSSPPPSPCLPKMLQQVYLCSTNNRAMSMWLTLDINQHRDRKWIAAKLLMLFLFINCISLGSGLLAGQNEAATAEIFRFETLCRWNNLSADEWSRKAVGECIICQGQCCRSGSKCNEFFLCPPFGFSSFCVVVLKPP